MIITFGKAQAVEVTSHVLDLSSSGPFMRLTYNVSSAGLSISESDVQI